MAKRYLFNELAQGLAEAKEHTEGKRTLRTHQVETRPLPKLTPEQIKAIRVEHLNLSQGVFALSLRVSVRTLEGWEQGKSKPNDQAIALMLMCQKYPDTFVRLSKLC